MSEEQKLKEASDSQNVAKAWASVALREAAPELLEMLKTIRRERLTPGSPFYKEVTKLIEKAEGRSS